MNVEEHIEHAGDEIPDPGSAKIAELTEYCRRVGRWPDRWKELRKAADKRSAFKRFFLPGDESSIDPNDPLHMAAEAVEACAEDDLLARISDLAGRSGISLFELGGLLVRADESGCWAAEGYRTFKDWVDAKTSVRYRSARYYIKTYRVVTDLKISWAQIERVGWSKMRLLLQVLDAESKNRWLETAAGLSWEQLEAEVKRHVDESRSSEDGGMEAPSESEAKTWSCRLHPQQRETVDLAFERLAKELHGDAGDVDKGVLLETLCASYLSSDDARPAASAAAARVVGEMSEEEALDSVQEVVSRIHDLMEDEHGEGIDSATKTLEVLDQILMDVLGCEISWDIEDRSPRGTNR